MAGRREKARLGDARQFCLSPPFGHVFISDNDAFGLLVAGVVRQDPAHEPVTALPLDFPLQGRLTTEDCLGVVQESVVGRERLEIRERAPDVARNYIEELSRRWCEEPYVEPRVEKNRCDFGSVKDF